MFDQHGKPRKAGQAKRTKAVVEVLLRNRLTSARVTRLGDAKSAALLSASNTWWTQLRGPEKGEVGERQG